MKNIPVSLIRTNLLRVDEKWPNAIQLSMDNYRTNE